MMYVSEYAFELYDLPNFWPLFDRLLLRSSAEMRRAVHPSDGRSAADYLVQLRRRSLTAIDEPIKKDQFRRVLL
jgi:hypothetical protein